MPSAPRTLKELREERNWTQAMLAAETGQRVTASTVGRIERAQNIPERKTREDIARALGVRVEDIAWPEAVAPAEAS